MRHLNNIVVIASGQTDTLYLHEQLRLLNYSEEEIHLYESLEDFYDYSDTGHQPTLLLVDNSVLNYPNIDLFKNLRKRFSAIPIVLLIDCSEEENVIKFISEGAQSYLVKRNYTLHHLRKTILISTEHIRLKNENESKNRQVENILETITDSFFVVDSHWVVKYWNQAAEKETGVRRSQVIDHNFWQIFPQYVGTKLYSRYQNAMTKQVKVHFEKYFDKANKWYDISVYPSQNGLSVYFKNITEKKAFKKAKLETEQRFTALVQNGADMIGILDETGKYKYVSATVKRVLGYDESFFLGKTPFEFIYPDDVPTVLSIFHEVLTSTQPKTITFRFKSIDGWKWIETNAMNLLNNPIVNGIVVNSRDITERKEQEVERELMIKELTKSNNDLKQFSFITSHNLRSPLSNLEGILNIIDKETLSSHNEQMFAMAKISTERLAKTINDLTQVLIIRNNSSPTSDCLNLYQLFNEVKSTFFAEENNIAAKFTVDFQVEQVHFNRIYFESIFINLVSNAIKYKSLKRELHICVSSRINEKGHFVLQFSDNGIGINLRQNKERLFGMYQRFHSDTEGEGLGLFIVKAQVTALGGNIDVESEVDKGTIFTLTLPPLASNNQ